MLPFPSLGSISQCYAYDKYDDFIEGGKFGTVFRAQAIEDRHHTTQLRVPINSNNISRSPFSGASPDRAVLSAGSFVALKQIDKQTLVSDKDYKDVVNEVEVLRRLNHRNCLSFHEAFQTPSTVVIVMELIDEGEELMQALKSLCDSASVGPSGQVVGERKSREQWSVLILRQLLEGIKYLHKDCRIVHRDMKPENILVCPDPTHVDGIRVVIVDYGLAKYIGKSSSTTSAFAAANTATPLRPRANMMVKQRSETILRRCDSVDSVDGHCNSPVLSTPCGTMKFTAPETVRGLLEKGPEPRPTTRHDILALDMFSVGIILFAMLTGKLPFPGSNQVEQARQMEAGPVYDNKDWAAISDSARDFVGRLLNPVPHDRITVVDAMRHGWVAAAAPSPSSRRASNSLSSVSNSSPSQQQQQHSPSSSSCAIGAGIHNNLSSSHLLGASFTRSSPMNTLNTAATKDAANSTMEELHGIYGSTSFDRIMGSRRSTDLAEIEEETTMPSRGLTRSTGPANNVASVDDLYGQLQLAHNREGRTPDHGDDDDEDDEGREYVDEDGTGEEEDDCAAVSHLPSATLRGGRCHAIPFGGGGQSSGGPRPPPLITSANPYFGFACEE